MRQSRGNAVAGSCGTAGKGLVQTSLKRTALAWDQVESGLDTQAGRNSLTFFFLTAWELCQDMQLGLEAAIKGQL